MQQPAPQTPAPRKQSDSILTALSWLLARHRRRTCPICGHLFYPGDCAVVNAHATNNQGVFEVKIQPPVGRWHILWERSFPKPLKGQEAVFEDLRRQCPDCDGILPSDYERARNYIVGIIGVAESGKSHYIRQLFNDLFRSDVTKAIGATKTIPDIPPSVENEWGPAATDMSRALPRNPRGRPVDPFVLGLKVKSHGLFRQDRSINLIFYDPPGESTVNPRIRRNNFPQIFEADALIILADPEQMRQVAEFIPPEARSNEDNNPKDPAFKVLDEITGKLEQRRAGILPFRSKLRLPVAITVSKSDLLDHVANHLIAQRGHMQQTVRDFPHEYDFLSDREYPSPLERDAFDETSEHVRQFLVDVGESQLANKGEGLPNCRYFAVSATGCPRSEDGIYRDLQPRRVADPVLWILLKLHVIDNNVYANKETGKRIVLEVGGNVRDALGKTPDWNEPR